MILLLCLLSLCFDGNRLAAAVDTMTGNQSLSGDQTLVSSGGNFALGFFQPGNSPYYYIGIWYNRISVLTIVWVANRDNPVEDKASTRLEILGGNIILVNDSKIPAWSTNVTSFPGSSAGGTVMAVLGDDGNLMLISGSNSSSTDAPLWQSFDHPTHTFLPGAKLGIDKRTNKTTLLTSWKNADDPAVGLYSLQLQPSSQYFINWNMSKNYWTSGVWDNRSQTFSLVPEMRLNYIYNFSYVDNENESYFTYSVYKSANTISRMIIDITGQIKQLSWLTPTMQWNLFWSQPRQQCEVYRLCGPYGFCSESTDNFCSCLPGFSIASPNDWNLSDWSKGCTRSTNLSCGANVAPNAEKDGFLRMSNVKLPDGSQSSSARSFVECESSCLNNCFCTGFAFQDGSCSVWSGELFNLQKLTADDPTAKSFYLRLAPSGLTFTVGKTNVAAIVGVSVAGAVVIAVIVLLGFWVWKRRSTRTKTTDGGTFIAFSYKDLQTATKNFSDKLGGGEFGSVFKGTLPDSSVIVVKKLESISQGQKQFRAEVTTVGLIQHVNLAQLRGFCTEGNKKLLVHDYMSNGSLNVHLFDVRDSKVLNWRTRYQIALGTARGLTYLHEKRWDCIIHCDVKPENILLDAEFVPKVADFGLAQLVGREFSRVLMRGTRGYLAPEWISGVDITPKADVYSYGMMLFEIVSGRRNSKPSGDRQVEFFPTWAASKVVEGGNLLDLLDPRLEREADVEELRRICRVACWCIQEDEARRPKMSQVVQILEGVVEVNMPPVPRALPPFGE